MAERRATGVQLLTDLLKLLLADVIGLLVARHLVGQVALERQGFLIHILAPGQNARSNPAMVGGRYDPQVVGLARGKHGIPEVLGVFGRILEVNLVPLLSGKAGLGHDHVVAGHLAFHQAVVGNVPDGVAKQVRHQGFRLGPLNLHGRHIDFRNGDIESHANVYAPHPQLKITVGERKPELVLGDPQQNRIIDDATLFIAEDDVLATHGLDLGRIPGDHVIHEPLGIRAFDLDLTLNRHVPHGDVVDQRLVLQHGAAVFRANITPGVVHTVVDCRAPAARLIGQMPVR